MPYSQVLKGTMQWLTRYQVQGRYQNIAGSHQTRCFVQADNVGVLNTAEEKLGWIFTAFDADGGGSIDVEEIRFNILLGLEASLTMRSNT